MSMWYGIVGLIVWFASALLISISRYEHNNTTELTANIMMCWIIGAVWPLSLIGFIMFWGIKWIGTWYYANSN